MKKSPAKGRKKKKRRRTRRISSPYLSFHLWKKWNTNIQMGLVIFFLKYKTKPESQMKSKPTFIKKILNLEWCPSKQKAKQLQIEQGKKKRQIQRKSKKPFHRGRSFPHRRKRNRLTQPWPWLSLSLWFSLNNAPFNPEISNFLALYLPSPLSSLSKI